MSGGSWPPNKTTPSTLSPSASNANASGSGAWWSVSRCSASRLRASTPWSRSAYTGVRSTARGIPRASSARLSVRLSFGFRPVRLCRGRGTYPIDSMASRTLAAVSSATNGLWLITNETVDFDTPAISATLRIDILALSQYLSELPGPRSVRPRSRHKTSESVRTAVLWQSCLHLNAGFRMVTSHARDTDLGRRDDLTIPHRAHSSNAISKLRTWHMCLLVLRTSV